MPVNFTITDCVELLTSEPESDFIITEETADVIDFDLKEAARLADRELREGTEFRPGTIERRTMFVFLKKENA